MANLSDNEIDKACERIWYAHGSLRGLGSLFTQENTDIQMGHREFYGIGLLLKKISNELEDVEDFLRYGPKEDFDLDKTI